MVELFKLLNIKPVLALVGASLINLHPTFRNAIRWLITHHIISVVISWDGRSAMSLLSIPYGKYYHDIITCHFKMHRYKKISMAQADLLNTITNVLVLSVKKCEVLSDDGYDPISIIIHWKYEEIREWCPTKSKLTTTREGYSYRDQK